MNAAKETRDVESETINAYRVQKLSDGSVRIKAGGYVVTGPTYFEALERYAQYNQEQLERLPDHLREDHRESIYDGAIPLRGFNSSGFTPEEILDAVTGHPLDVVLSDLAQNSDHDELCWCYECEVVGDDDE